MKQRSGRMKNERGGAMVMAMFALVIMSVIGLSIAFTSGQELKSSKNELLANQAFYAAESGLQEAMHVLRGNRAPSGSGNCSTSVANAINFQIATNPCSSNLSTDQVTFPRLSRWLTYNSSDQNGVVILNPSAPALQRIGYRLQLTAPDADTIEVASTGFAPMGAQRTLRLRVASPASLLRRAGLLDLPSVITLMGDDPTGTAGPSNAHSLNGLDCTGNSEKPIVGAVGVTNAIHAWANSFSSNRTDTFDTSLPLSPTSGVVADISTPNPALNVTGNIPFNNSAAEARDFIAEVSKVADVVISSGGSVPSGGLGTSAAPKVVVAQGDLSLNGGGAGLLIVQGELTLRGNFAYEGIILVLGNGHITRRGGGNGTISGGILVGAYTNNSSSFNGASDFDTSGGGNSTIRYCSTAIAKALNALPPISVQSYAAGGGN